MITGHAVELTFDAESEQRVLSVWQSLDHGLDLEAMGARPHISLAAFWPPADSAVLTECVAAYAESAAPIELHLSAVGSFPGEGGVVYIAPASSQQLLKSHRTFHSILTDHGVVASGLYLPDRWVPHCTVALEVPHDDVPIAIGAVRESNAFGPVTIAQVTLVEFRPVRELFSRQIRQAH